MTYPCIAFIKQRHFIVLEKVRKHKKGYAVSVDDPAQGRVLYDAPSFLELWAQCNEEMCGYVIVFEPTPEFYSKESHDKKHDFLKSVMLYLASNRAYVLLILLLICVSGIISMAFPFLTKSIVDIGIQSKDIKFVFLILFAQFALVLGQVCCDAVSSWGALRINITSGLRLRSQFVMKLMSRPISFFESVLPGDIVRRIGDLDKVQMYMSGSLIGILAACGSLIVYGLVVGFYSKLIFLYFLLGSVLYVVWVISFMNQRSQLNFAFFKESVACQNNVLQTINGIRDIQLDCCESKKQSEWNAIQRKIACISSKNLRLNNIQKIGGTVIDQAKNILIAFMSAKYVIDGEITIGTMLSFQFILGQLNAPISQIISFAGETQDAMLSMKRIDEIAYDSCQNKDTIERIIEIPSDADIVFDKVTFQYGGPRSPKILDNLSFTIPNKKVTAIVGSSGSGKTTVIKLLLGFYPPTEGRIMIGDRPLEQYETSSWRKCCGAVLQDGFIFSNTIAENIGFSDPIPDRNRVKAAANSSNISGWIESLPFGYNTIIGADGNDISSGQKQRILIARAAYKNPNYLFLDEATNSLDANNELQIMGNVFKMFAGKTIVIVAHRLSTVKMADNIIVLENGRIEEEGTHEQLMLTKRKYYELVRNQLN